MKQPQTYRGQGFYVGWIRGMLTCDNPLLPGFIQHKRLKAMCSPDVSFVKKIGTGINFKDPQ